MTLLEALQGSLIKANLATAKDSWEHVEKIFMDNKRIRSIALKDELHVIHLGDLSVDAYFHKTESIVALLNDLWTPMNNDGIVTYALSRLSEKFSHVAGIIAYRDPFPNLEAKLHERPFQT